MSAGGIKEGLTMPHMYRSQIHFASLRSVLFPYMGFMYLGWDIVTQILCCSKILKTGIQYFTVSSMHTSLQLYFASPVTQLIQSFCEGRKASLLIFCTIIGISDADTGIDPCFVDIKSTAVKF